MPVDWLDWVEGESIVEFGCGSGGALEKVLSSLPDVKLVGIDPDEKALARAREKLGGRAEFIRSAGEDVRLPRGAFDAALFIHAPHEIFTASGREGVLSCLRKAHDCLKHGGTLIVRDHCGPDPGRPEFAPPTPVVREALVRFARDFRTREIWTEEREDGSFLIEGADLYEFLTKYRDLDSDWEMVEVHFPFDESGWKETLREAGFAIERFERWAREIEPDEFLPNGWVLEGAELAFLARAR